MASGHEVQAPQAGTVREVLAAFFQLGLTSFGGPIAHLGYFRRELVERRRWLQEEQFAQVLAVCQFLPGPSSSQLGFALGLLRAGWAGALAAFVAFTLPSAVLMFALASAVPSLAGAQGAAALHGLKLVALVVVAHGVVGMARQLCPDLRRAVIAVGAASLVIAIEPAWIQLVAVAFGGVAGLLVCRQTQPIVGHALQIPYGRRLGGIFLAVFLLLLLGLPWMAQFELLNVFEAFYRAGALVFGGGHVVLPLLEETVVESGWISADDFLTGYGAAQAVPGPMFTLSVFLGARLDVLSDPLLGAATALSGIFLPGFLLLAGILPFWHFWARQAAAARAIAGVNAAVVGLLAAALYDPVWSQAIRGGVDLGIALIGILLFTVGRAPALLIVTWCVVGSVAATLL